MNDLVLGWFFFPFINIINYRKENWSENTCLDLFHERHFFVDTFDDFYPQEYIPTINLN